MSEKVEITHSLWIEKKRFRYCPVCMVGQEVTHWMPLPDAPEVEEMEELK